ncbi:MAG: hypothetical protein ACYDG4_16815 [Desulfuromonadaceae bacterium]
MTITAHFYDQSGSRPITVFNIDPQDSDFIQRNKVKVSLEELGGSIIAYARPISEPEENEIIYIQKDDEECEMVMSELVRECRIAFKLT